MRFKLDENLPPSAERLFTARGHDTTSVRSQHHLGIEDPPLLEILLESLQEGPLHGCLWVVQPHRIRIRHGSA